MGPMNAQFYNYRLFSISLHVCVLYFQLCVFFLQAKDTAGTHSNSAPSSNGSAATRTSGGAGGGGASAGSSQSSGPGQPVEFNHAISYVNKIKVEGEN